MQSSDHLVRSQQEARRHHKPKLFGGSEVDGGLKLRRLLYRQFRWVRSVEDASYVRGRTVVLTAKVGAIAHKMEIDYTRRSMSERGSRRGMPVATRLVGQFAVEGAQMAKPSKRSGNGVISGVLD